MKKILWALIITTLLMPAFPSCNIIQGKYKSITVKNKLCSYTLEYAAFYKKNGPITQLTGIHPGTYLNLVAPEIRDVRKVPDPYTGKIQTVTGYYSPAAITIDVFDTTSEDSDNLKTAADYIQASLDREAKWSNFKLLNRTPITLSGINVETITYLVDAFMPVPVENGVALEYNIMIYFDYNGLIWNIQARCNNNMSESVQVDFDHIIQTFKILE